MSETPYIYTMHKLGKQYPPDRVVVKDVTLAFLHGAKIGVLGTNGSGKSTLLKIMAGLDTRFIGDAQLAAWATVGYLSQEPELDETKDVRGNVEDGVRPTREMLDRFNAISMELADPDAADRMDALLEEMGRLQDRIDSTDAWSLDRHLDEAMDALRLPPGDSGVKTLSGGEKVIAPSIAIVGDVVRLRDEMSWFDRRPLFGRTIVVTRAREQASQLRTLLEIAGASVIEAPAIRIEPLDPALLRASLEEIATYDWLVATSRNAVEMLWATLRDLGLDARALARAKICAVGPATADALLAHGLAVDVIPDRYVAEGVIEKLRARHDVRGARVLFPRAAGARELLPAAMREMGAEVSEIEIYRSVPDLSGLDTLRAALDAGTVDLVTFTSASTVRHFVDALGAERAQTVRGASIGPVTSDAARALGVPIAIEAAESSIASLVQAITTHLAR
jgi:uroporphyrinogen-III synthase/energy-coupling factor transporter ATP-binding protein EcfA2